jgi:hypothetical protein
MIHIFFYTIPLGYCRLFIPLYFDKIKTEYLETIPEHDVYKQNRYENETGHLGDHILIPSKIVTVETDQLFLGMYLIYILIMIRINLSSFYFCL